MNTKYRRELDGLRAIAILSVIVFHSGIKLLDGGFIGVDIFFVISGYLITSIVFTEKESKNFSLINFYERRICRILPLLFLVIFASIPLAWLLLDQRELHSFSQSIVASVLFSSNYFFSNEEPYFKLASELKPLIHTWSLGIEGQYYLFFPLLILLIWPLGKKYVYTSLILLAIFSLIFAEVKSYQHLDVFYSFPARIFELVSGTITYFSVKKLHKFNSKNVKEYASLFGLILIFYAILFFNKQTPWPSIYSIVPILGTSLIIIFASPNNIVGKFLGGNLLVSIGLVSYGAYLWHQIIFVFLRHYIGPMTNEIIIKVIVCIFIIAYLSWKYIEKPFRYKMKRGSKEVFILSGIFVILLIFFGYLGIEASRLDENFAEETEAAKLLVGKPVIYSTPIDRFEKDQVNSRHSWDERQFQKQRLIYEIINPKVIVLGSSRVMQINSKDSKLPLLNLGVSGASLEDDVALYWLSRKKYKPNFIFIGMDPWLFNENSGQLRWKSLEADYNSAIGREIEFSNRKTKSNYIFAKNLNKFYQSINISRKIPQNDLPEFKDKIRSDGSRVYNLSYANLTQTEIIRDMDNIINYSMLGYKRSKVMENKFLNFINQYKKESKIILILSPYHPYIYEYMRKYKPIFLEIENEYINFAFQNNLKIIGSFNPQKIGCNKNEFFDGMHPKDSCMEKIINQI